MVSRETPPLAPWRNRATQVDSLVSSIIFPEIRLMETQGLDDPSPQGEIDNFVTFSEVGVHCVSQAVSELAFQDLARRRHLPTPCHDAAVRPHGRSKITVRAPSLMGIPAIPGRF